MRNVKRIIPFSLVVFLSACGNAGYVKCKKVTCGNQTYQSTDPIYISIAKYKLSENVDSSVKTYDGCIYVSQDGQNQNFPTSVTAEYLNASEGIQVSVNATLEYKIGTYSSFSVVYYSKSKKQIKIQEYKNKKVKGNKDKEIQEKVLIKTYFYTTGIMTLNVFSNQTFKTNTTTTYVDAGDSVVAYTV